MPRLPDLGKMKDEDYKLLTPQQLLAYNVHLPEQDYDAPYNPTEHPYPRTKFAVVEVDGVSRLRTVIVKDATEERKLPPGYVNSPTELGIETAPGAPTIATMDYDVPVERVANETVMPTSKQKAKADAAKAAAE